MTSTVRKMSNARSVRSRALPSGVATTYNDPGVARAACVDCASSLAYGLNTSTDISFFMYASHRAARLMILVRRVGAALFVAGAALSCAPLSTTSRPAPIIEGVPAPRSIPAPLPAPIEPPVSVYPLAPPADVESTPPSTSAMPEEPRAQRRATPTNDSVALILPLDVPAYARAAEAVRDGFIAAAESAGQRAKVIVIAHKQDGVLAAFDQARARGVRVAVGPLLRDDLKTLALADPEIPWTIALNQLDDRSALPPTVFSFALTVESDARVLAHLAQEE